MIPYLFSYFKGTGGQSFPWENKSGSAGFRLHKKAHMGKPAGLLNAVL